MNERTLDINDLKNDPFEQFAVWYSDWVKEGGDVTQCPATLATVDDDGHPSARVVLLKSWDKNGFVFFTNYNSRKGREMARNPNVSLSFFWPQFARQVKIKGVVEKVSAKESDEYFASRDLDSRLGAWASKQSEEIPDRKWLIDRVEEFREKYSDGKVPRPEGWGGFRIKAHTIEFWQGRLHRLHDRFQFKNVSGAWRVARLSP